jgi:hypothetical protein
LIAHHDTAPCRRSAADDNLDGTWQIEINEDGCPWQHLLGVNIVNAAKTAVLSPDTDAQASMAWANEVNAPICPNAMQPRWPSHTIRDLVLTRSLMNTHPELMPINRLATSKAQYQTCQRLDTKLTNILGRQLCLENPMLLSEDATRP